MGRVVSNVFKLIGFSIIAMIIGDLTAGVIDLYVATAKTTAINNTIQAIVMENNYLPSDAEVIFKEQFTKIDELSSVVNGEIEIEVTTSSGALVGQTPQQYGDFITIEVRVPTTFSLFGYAGGKGNASVSDLALFSRDSTTVFTYVVPCLRYLKIEN